MAVSKMFLFIFLFVFKSINAHYIDSLRDLQPCGEPLLVEKETVIDAQSYENCKLQIQTQPNRILAFNLVHGDLEQAKEFINVFDGSGTDILENQKVHNVSRKDLPKTFYTTNSAAEIVFKNMPTSPLQIKMQKAVDCPFNLGGESQCGRVVDEVSCYCAIFTKRSHQGHTDFCKNNGMLLVALESYPEEQAIHTAWGSTIKYWTSGSDSVSEGTWIWQSTGQPLYPGYANWSPGEPNNEKDAEDCLYIGFTSSGSWNDAPCGEADDAVCEEHP